MRYGRPGDLKFPSTYAGGRFLELDVAGSLQLLHAWHVRERDKALLRGIMVGEEGVWNGFLLGHAKGEIVPCRFCVGFDGDLHLFSDVLTLLWFKFMKILSFTI